MDSDIKRNDLILEVGSGDFPSHFSDVLVDKYPFDNFQRNKNICIDKRIFIAADAQRLPFRDKVFDYCIASNVLPYVENPELFFGELMRVAGRGVIIGISEIFERLRDIEFHCWYVNLKDDKIVLKRKVSSNRGFGKLFHLLCEEDKHFQRFLNKHWYLFNLTYRWQGRINYEIVNDSIDVINLEDREIVRGLIKDKRRVWHRFLNAILTSSLKNFILGNYIRIRKNHKKIRLSDILMCLNCKGEVSVQTDSIVCSNCKKIYPIKNGIPFMFLDE